MQNPDYTLNRTVLISEILHSGGSRIFRRGEGRGPVGGGAWTSDVGTFWQKCM